MKTFAQDIRREEMAKQDVAATRISRTVGIGLTVCFFAVLFGVPLLQLFVDRAKYKSGESLDNVSGGAKLFSSVKDACTETMSSAVQSKSDRLVLFNRLLNRNISRYENGLAEASFMTDVLLPPAQFVNTYLLGIGNEKVYTGSGGWLYYRDDVDFVTVHGFMEPGVQKKRRDSGKAWDAAIEPDPFPAIVEFRDYLRTKGIDLILLPVPVKPSVHPEHLGWLLRKQKEMVNNPSAADFRKRAGELGIECIFLDDLMSALKNESQKPLYLLTDTHWRPEAMSAVAGYLAGILKARYEPEAYRAYETLKVEMYNEGDTARMIKLPECGQGYAKEKVLIETVLSADDQLPWQADKRSEILFLGDSFANIYSQQSLGWGMNAGLCEQVSRFMEAPVDRIIRNDDGAFATREILRDELGADKDRLKGKRVVIWEFSERELLYGNWEKMMFESANAQK